MISPQPPERSVAMIVQCAEIDLDLVEATLSDEYFYSSVSLCLIDAVFSIGVLYAGVQNVVARYCENFSVRRFRSDRSKLPDRSDQEPLSELLERLRSIGPDAFAEKIFRNRQRTSTRSGILKAEAVLRFGDALHEHGVEYLQDIDIAASNRDLADAVRAIPGQQSGISLQYFWMLAGSEDLIKPDRMIHRYLARCLGRKTTAEEAQQLLHSAAGKLRASYEQITPRLLDFEIWKFERARS